MTTILLDMDGPLAGFDQAFFAKPQMMRHLSIESREQQTSWFFTEFIPDERVRDAVRRHINQPGWYRELPVVDGAYDGVAELEAESVDLWVCTRPHPDVPSCASEKQAWLLEHFPSIADKLITTPDKSMVHGDLLLDDAPPLNTVRHPTWTPVVFREPYNGTASKWGHLPSWKWGDPIEHLLNVARSRP